MLRAFLLKPDLGELKQEMDGYVLPLLTTILDSNPEHRHELLTRPIAIDYSQTDLVTYFSQTICASGTNPRQLYCVWMWLILTLFLFDSRYSKRMESNTLKHSMMSKEIQRLMQVYINGDSAYHLLLRGWIRQEQRKMNLVEMIDELAIFYNCL